MPVGLEPHSPAEEAELDRALMALEPFDVAAAERNLKEIKHILDEAGITFFLREGTLLGAVRDGCLIPWDDDVDIASIFGLHVFSEDTLERVARMARDRGFLVRVGRNHYNTVVSTLGDSSPLHWSCHHVIDDAIFMFPAVRLPLRLFTDLKEISFLGERFLVPQPPEEYLAAKYGQERRVPKRAGEYERDVLAMIPETPTPGWVGRMSVAGSGKKEGPAKIAVSDESGKPAVGAAIFVAGVGTFRADTCGVVSLPVPTSDHYALTVTFGHSEHVIYVERIDLDQEYAYRLGDDHLRLEADTD
jgi:hypothetical protein